MSDVTLEISVEVFSVLVFLPSLELVFEVAEEITGVIGAMVFSGEVGVFAALAFALASAACFASSITQEMS